LRGWSNGFVRGLTITAAFLSIQLIGCLQQSALPNPQSSSGAASTGTDALEILRQAGDLSAQRRHVWEVIRRITDPAEGGDQPTFESWHGEEEIFTAHTSPSRATGIRSFARETPAEPAISDVPVLTYTLYNDAAFHHLVQNRLNRRDELNRLVREGPADSVVIESRSVPALPAASMVLKTVWWPVAGNGLTPMPVWDPELNPPKKSGNDYLSWARVVVVDPTSAHLTSRTSAVDFAGRTFDSAHRVALDDFYHVAVDKHLADRLSRDREAHNVGLIALGRPIREGDYLLLVGANLATKEILDWVWGATWWHDRPDEGPFAADRPGALRGVWRHYLMQAAFDSLLPLMPDGSPHVCFNPWLEGRFPDGGNGAGTVSNCMACHQRANYPSKQFLPVTRGRGDLQHDGAYAAGRLRTNSIWAITLHATR
jgi:hypothetical protein